MVDPLTIFAAAGNALQFVQLGVDIIGQTIKYSKGGGRNEFQALRDCVQRLSASNAHLQSSMETTAAQQLPPGPARALHAANVECLRVSRNASAALDRLGLNTPHNVWSSVKLAIKSQIHRDELSFFSMNLNHARANLMLSLMVFVSHQSAAFHENLDQHGRLVAEQTSKVITESRHIKDDIAELGESLSALQFAELPVSANPAEVLRLQEYQSHIISSRVEDVLIQHESHLSNKIRGLTDHLERIDTGVKSFFLEVRQLFPTMTREISARRQILDSLWFLKLDHRRNRITRAHDRTYQWIFKHKADEAAMWDDFLDWLQDGDHGVYWVSGKPGSGKSTIMRELDKRTTEKTPEDPDLVDNFLTASFYFWYAGNSEEKSTCGMLRSLIYQLLLEHPEVIDEVVSRSRWEAALGGKLHQREWAEVELTEVMCKTLQNLGDCEKILLFIDGLDEQDGSDEERQTSLNILQNLSETKNVKLCLASRPWNIFRDAFQKCPRLRLEDLTKGDIELYVHDNLGADQHFQRLLQREPELLDIFKTRIVERARGVFLWVRLVIRDLSGELRDGCRSRRLLKAFESIPPELDDYFRRMFESIDTRYRQEASIILQTALCTVEWEEGAGRPSRTEYGREFFLIHLHFLEDSADPCFAAKSHLFPVNFDDMHELHEFLGPLERVLASRGMGLLEIDVDMLPPDWTTPYLKSPLRMNPQPQLARIEFLHRTVRDYFTTPGPMRLLHEYCGYRFDAHLFRCNLLVTNMALHEGLSTPHSLKRGSAILLLDQIQQRPDGEAASYSLFHKMVDLIRENVSELKSEHDRDVHQPIAYSLETWSREHSNAMTLAIDMSWTTYVKAHLTPEMISKKQGRPLLDCALRTSADDDFLEPKYNILVSLLDEGACPDAKLGRDENAQSWFWKPLEQNYEGMTVDSVRQDNRILSPSENSDDWLPFWIYLCLWMGLSRSSNFKPYLKTFKAILHHGVRTRVTEEDFYYVHDLVSERLIEIGRQNDESLMSNGLQASNFSTRTPLDTHAEKSRYSLWDLFRGWRWFSDDGQEFALFSDAEIAELEDLVQSSEHSPLCQYHLSPSDRHLRNKPRAPGSKRGREVASSPECEPVAESADSATRKVVDQVSHKKPKRVQIEDTDERKA